MAIRIVTGLLSIALSAPCSYALTSQELDAETQRGDFHFKSAMLACHAKTGHPRTSCETRPEGSSDVARLVLEARHKPTEVNLRQERSRRAEGALRLAEAQCLQLGVHDKPICVAEPQVKNSKPKASNPPASTASGNVRASKARKEQKQNAHNAEYEAAVQACDELPGNESAACLDEAKTHLPK